MKQPARLPQLVRSPLAWRARPEFCEPVPAAAGSPASAGAATIAAAMVPGSGDDCPNWAVDASEGIDNKEMPESELAIARKRVRLITCDQVLATQASWARWQSSFAARTIRVQLRKHRIRYSIHMTSTIAPLQKTPPAPLSTTGRKANHNQLFRCGAACENERAYSLCQTNCQVSVERSLRQPTKRNKY